MNSSSLVYHHPSPLASLLALVCAYTLHYQTRLAVNYYSPAYAKHMKQLVHLLYPQEDAAPIQSLAYHMIRHAGRHYERPLAELMDICITVPQHKRLFECLDTLLTYTLNLCADPNAASIIADQAERFDPHQRKRAAITILMAATTVALLLIAGLGVMGPGLILQSGVGSASLTAGAVCMAYLWRRSEYRPPPVSIALKNLSIAVKIPLAGVPALPPL